MTIRSRNKLVSALRNKFGSPRALLRALGIDENLADVGQPGSGEAADPVQKLRTSIELLIPKLGLGEKEVALLLEMLDAEAPMDKLPDDDPNREKAAALAGDDPLESFRKLLRTKGLSEEDISSALEIARSGGDRSNT